MSNAGRVTVYSREGCVQCTATFRALDSRRIRAEVVDVDAETIETLKAEGFQQLPVVKVEGGATWAGFRPDRIAEIDAEIAR